MEKRLWSDVFFHEERKQLRASDKVDGDRKFKKFQ